MASLQTRWAIQGIHYHFRWKKKSQEPAPLLLTKTGRIRPCPFNGDPLALLLIGF